MLRNEISMNYLIQYARVNTGVFSV